MGSYSMARDIPPALLSRIQDEVSPDALIGFVTITHPGLVAPLRIVSDPIDFVCGGELYIGCPFEFQPLTDEDTAPTTTLRVQNADRRIGEALRGMSDRATVQLEARSTADFDLSVVPRTEIGSSSVLYGFRYFELTDVTVTPIDVSGTLMIRDYSQEPYPGKRATQTRCPGLFR